MAPALTADFSTCRSDKFGVFAVCLPSAVPTKGLPLDRFAWAIFESDGELAEIERTVVDGGTVMLSTLTSLLLSMAGRSSSVQVEDMTKAVLFTPRFPGFPYWLAVCWGRDHLSGMRLDQEVSRGAYTVDAHWKEWQVLDQLGELRQLCAARDLSLAITVVGRLASDRESPKPMAGSSDLPLPR